MSNIYYIAHWNCYYSTFSIRPPGEEASGCCNVVESIFTSTCGIERVRCYSSCVLRRIFFIVLNFAIVCC